MPRATGNGRSVKAHRHAAQTQQPMYNNLFAACLPRWLDNTQLYEIFAEFEPMSATIMMDVNTGRSKGFGFVLFRNSDDGYRALCHLNGRLVTVGGTTFSMYVSPSKYDGFSACAESTRVYLRNIPMSMTADDVVGFFSRHGTIKTVELRPDDHEASWLVTLEYTAIAEAKTAINQTHGKLLFPNLTSIPVMAKFAESNEGKPQRRRKKHEQTAIVKPLIELELSTTSDSSHKGSQKGASLFPGLSEDPSYEGSHASGSDTPNSQDGLQVRTPCSSEGRSFRHDPYSEAGWCVV